jgi:NAD-dependent SIR2 family protein deacetylase
MATYHGLVKASCIACHWETKDEPTIEMLNDLDGTCPKCEKQFFRWENENGSIVVSLTQEIDGLHTYDNLVMRG